MNVMTGGYSAEYGNRFGGILEVVTKSGFTIGNRGSVSLGAGTAQRHNVGLEFGGHAQRTAYYLNLTGFTSDRFLSPPAPRSIHNTGRGFRGFGQLDFRLNDANDIKLVMMGDGVNFQLPMEERDEVLRPDFKNLQRTRSQSLIASLGRVHSARTVTRTSFYQKWSGVHQFPDTIDPYGAQTDAERTLGTLGVKSDITRLSGRHTVKGGVDLVLLRPHEDLYYLSQPWIDFTHLPTVNESHVHFRRWPRRQRPCARGWRSARARQRPRLVRDALSIALHAECVDWMECEPGREPAVPVVPLRRREPLEYGVFALEESTMVQGQYSIPRLLSGFLKIGF